MRAEENEAKEDNEEKSAAEPRRERLHLTLILSLILAPDSSFIPFFPALSDKQHCEPGP